MKFKVGDYVKIGKCDKIYPYMHLLGQTGRVTNILTETNICDYEVLVKNTYYSFRVEELEQDQFSKDLEEVLR